MADEKITQKTALTTPAGGDLLYIVDDTSGTPIGKKITLTNLFENVPGTLDLSGITDGNVPYMSASGFADSPMQTDGTDVSIAQALTFEGQYKLSERNNGFPSLQNTTSGQSTVFEVYTADGDGTDGVGLTLWSVGTPASVIDRERLQVRYDVGQQEWIMQTDAGGTGTIRALQLYTKDNSGQLYLATDGNVGIRTTSPSANADLTLEGGILNIKETTTPTADADYGKVYTKSDNKLYFQDGAGIEKEIAFV